jgi:hypothetical protein
MSDAVQWGSQGYVAHEDRVAGYELLKQASAALADPCVQVVLEAVQGYLVILNSSRQILAANRELLDALNRETPGCLIGLRPGEALNCIHFTEGPNGCGTSSHCRACGAVLAILASQNLQKRVTDECRLSSFRNGELVAMDFRVTASPLKISGQELTALVLTDISSEKRREVLEQVFLHDVLNSLGGLEAWGQFMQGLDPQAAAREILDLAESLKAEVLSQRTLLAAEGGDLEVHKRPCHPAEVFRTLRNVFAKHPSIAGKDLQLASPAQEMVLLTDRALLLRVLINMVKNALEATGTGGVVRVWYEARDKGPAFVVENPGMVPNDVRLHIFERSFTTKASKGRGLGTYSMKLFGERYLKGTVSFTSENGTTRFWIQLPPEALLAAPQSPGAGSPPQEHVKVPTDQARHVLFVEDDEALSRLGSLFLKRLSYEVTACRNGVEAAAAFQAAPAKFDLVLTDAQMPGMGGYELARRLREIRKDIPVVLCTGEAPPVSSEQEDGGFCAALMKPFSLSSLTETLNRALA